MQKRKTRSSNSFPRETSMKINSILLNEFRQEGTRAPPQDVKIVATTISQRVPLGYSIHTFHEKSLARHHGSRINGTAKHNRLVHVVSDCARIRDVSRRLLYYKSNVLR